MKKLLLSIPLLLIISSITLGEKGILLRKFKIEINEEIIKYTIINYISEPTIKIRKYGKITIDGKIGIIPIRLTTDSIEHDKKSISFILESGFKSIVILIIVRLMRKQYMSFNLLEKKLMIDIYKLIKSPDTPFHSSIKSKICDLVIEKFFTENSKITIIGEYSLLQSDI